jgi:hypothetical protein
MILTRQQSLLNSRQAGLVEAPLRYRFSEFPTEFPTGITILGQHPIHHGKNIPIGDLPVKKQG